jgi:NADH-quinone oxidoreductase subunit D
MPQFEASPWKTQQVVDELNQNRQGSLLDFIEDFTQRFPKCIDQYEALLTENRVWKQRTVGIGVVTPEQAKAWGFSGPMLRASGVAWDIRKVSPYAAYDQLSFEVPIGQSGDCYDRYMVRIEEMRQSNHLIQQCIAWLREHSGPVMSGDAKVSPPKRKDSKLGMEEMIHHYKLYTEGLMVPEGRVYNCIESPKGELGVYLVSDGANKPYRVKVRAPGFAHLSAFNELCQGHMIADIPAIISTLDVVFGEIDR